MLRSEAANRQILTDNDGCTKPETLQSRISPLPAFVLTVANMAEPGWYRDPTERHEYRWWTQKWTTRVGDRGIAGHDPLRPAWRRVLGLVLVGQIAVMPIVVFLLIGGDPYPRSRVGVTADEIGRIEVLNVACPGERLQRIELSHQPKVDVPAALIWAAEGDGPVPPVVVAGEDVPGLVSEVSLRAMPRPDDLLRVKVVTSELDFPAGLDFSVRDVPLVGVLSFEGVYGTVDDYRAAVLRQTPCSDPYGKETLGRIADWTILTSLAAALIGAIVLLPVPRYPPPSGT